MKMREVRMAVGAVAVGCALGFVAGCASTGIQHVAADEFIRQAQTMEMMNSASGTFYIGTTPTHAYVERTGLYKPFRLHKTMVYWTELDGLPPEIRDELGKGKLPWTPWQEGIKREDK